MINKTKFYIDIPKVCFFLFLPLKKWQIILHKLSRTAAKMTAPNKGGCMAKKQPKNTAVEHGRGEIRDNALKALVTGPLFKMRVVKAKKGKGAYQRYQRGQNNDNSALFFASNLGVNAYGICANS